MKGAGPLALLAVLAIAAAPARAQGLPAPAAIRDAEEAMPAAKIAAIPAFALPARYQDRARYPLPALHSNAASPHFNPYDPAISGLWREQGMSCGNAQSVGCLFNHEANRARGFATPKDAKAPEFSYQYTYHFLNDGDMLSGDAWMMVEAMDILKETGAMSTADFGGLEWGNAFLGWQSGYDKYHRAMRYRLEDYWKIDLTQPGADELVKQVLVDNADGSAYGGNLVVQVSFSNRITKTTLEGRPVYENYATGGGHALSIVGYDDAFLAERGGTWIMHDVHANGLSYSPRDRFKAGGPLAWPGIGIPALFLRVRPDYAPKLTFKAAVTHNQRGNIAIMTGVGGPTSTAPAVWKDYAGAFNYSGGSLPMAGRGQSPTLEFGLDLTDFAPQLSAPGQKLYFMVISKGGAGTIDKLALMDYTGAEAREIAATEVGKAIAPGTAGAPVMTTLAIAFPGSLTVGLGPDSGNRGGRPGSPRMRLTPEGIAASTLNLRDLRGRTLAKPSGARGGLAAGAYLELPWDRGGIAR